MQDRKEQRMIVNPPARATRQAVHYVAMPLSVTIEELAGAVPGALDAVEAWLTSRGIVPSGPPLIRYRVIDMAAQMSVEIGWPVADLPDVAELVVADTLPAGEYGSCVFRGADNGIAGNGALIDWGAATGIAWDRWDTPEGDAFASRFELMLSGPDDNPDPTQWDMEVAILIAKD